MDFLRFLEGIRAPFLDHFFAGITHLAGEITFIVVGAILYWCVSKKYAYYIFAVGLFNVVTNQALKLVFRIPRPWVLDPDFTIVEAARAAATGYSFPSGHTQNAVGVFGALGIVSNRKAMRAVCLALVVLLPFSRMYLGVHTPLDVGVAFAIAATSAVALYPCFSTDERAGKTAKWVVCGTVAAALAYLLFALLWEAPADIDPVNYAEGMKNAYVIFAVAVAVAASFVLDKRFIRFETKGNAITQAVKIVFGLGITLAIKSLLKAPLYAVLGETYLADGVRYFVVATFALCLWPMTFSFIRKTCEKKTASEDGKE